MPIIGKTILPSSIKPILNTSVSRYKSSAERYYPYFFGFSLYKDVPTLRTYLQERILVSEFQYRKDRLQ